MTRFVRGLTVVLILLAPGSRAGAFTTDDVIRPFNDRIALCKAAEAELARQAAVFQSELETWKAWRAGLREEIERNRARLSEEHARARAAADQVVAAAQPLRPRNTEQSFVPHIGWGIFGFFEQHRDNTNRAIDEAAGQAQRGEMAFHVAGFGWTTGKQLDEALKADDAKIAAHRAAVDAGTFGISYPRLGGVNGQSLAACIRDEEAKITQTKAQIAAGEYGVVLPGLGAVTRNGLEAAIRQAEAELQAVRDAASAGTLGVVRAGHDGFNRRDGLDPWSARNRAAEDALTAGLSNGTVGHNFPGMGWSDANGLSAAIEARMADIARIEASAAEGRYGVPLTGGDFIDRTQASLLLGQPDCRQGGPAPCIDPGLRPNLEDALRRIPLAVQVDVGIRALEVARLRGWLAALESHMTPERARLETERKIIAGLSAEIDLDAAAHQRAIEAHIDWLRANLAQIP